MKVTKKGFKASKSGAFGLIIPKKMVEALGLTLDIKLNIKCIDKTIIITKGETNETKTIPK